MNDVRHQLRQSLLDSYKFRQDTDCSCTLCGRTGVSLAFHILEDIFDESEVFPLLFVPLSSSRGRVRGSYPICNFCAPECKYCNLPKPVEKVLEFGHGLKAQSGFGVCREHIQVGSLLLAIFKRVFKMGTL